MASCKYSDKQRGLAVINTQFNDAVKVLGAKWNGAEWVPPELAASEFDALDRKYNRDLIAVEITLTDDSRDSGAWLGAAHAISVCGYVVATAYGRDSGAKLAPGVAVIKGGFKSGGSVKNYRCMLAGDSVVIRCKVGRAMLSELQSKAGVTVLDAAPTISDELAAAIAVIERHGFSVTRKTSEQVQI